jgi:transcriptional regulator with PAS, ATPase and Fis domain
MEIVLPPLRERIDKIPLAHYLLQKIENTDVTKLF